VGVVSRIWSFYSHGRANVRAISPFGKVARRFAYFKNFTTGQCAATFHPVNSALCAWDSIVLVIAQEPCPQVRIGAKIDFKTDSFAMFESFCFVTEQESSSRPVFAFHQFVHQSIFGE